MVSVAPAGAPPSRYLAGNGAERRPKQRTENPARPAEGAERQVVHLLLVEDNPGDALLVEAMLQTSDLIYRLRHEESLERAVAVAAQPDLFFAAVLLDLNLPDSQGLHTVQQMRAAAPHLPIIVLTGLSDERVGVQAMRAGAQDYLVKGEFSGSLLERVIRYAGERKRMEEEERQLMEMKNDFIYLISHQLRTPLSSASGFLELLLSEKVSDPAVQREFLERSYEDVGRLTKLVNSLLDVARLESGQMPLERKALDLRDLVQETVEAMRPAASQKGIRLEYGLPDRPAPVVVDKKWITEVLSNLISNATKFSEPSQPIYVMVRLNGSTVTVAVRDEGPGIAPHELTHLFEKFYQGNSSAKQAGVGTGLGLYIARGIIEAHEGKISVKSSPGEGSIFYFTLPLVL